MPIRHCLIGALPTLSIPIYPQNAKNIAIDADFLVTIYRLVKPENPYALADPLHVTATLAERMPGPRKPKFRNGIQGMLER